MSLLPNGEDLKELHWVILTKRDHEERRKEIFNILDGHPKGYYITHYNPMYYQYEFTFVDISRGEPGGKLQIFSAVALQDDKGEYTSYYRGNTYQSRTLKEIIEFIKKNEGYE